jgi:hypothetical protein
MAPLTSESRSARQVVKLIRLEVIVLFIFIALILIADIHSPKIESGRDPCGNECAAALWVNENRNSLYLSRFERIGDRSAVRSDRSV